MAAVTNDQHVVASNVTIRRLTVLEDRVQNGPREAETEVLAGLSLPPRL